MKKLLLTLLITLISIKTNDLSAMEEPKPTDYQLNESLFKAVTENNTNQAQALLAQGAQVYATKCSALLVAPGRMQPCCMQVTPLHCAVALSLENKAPHLEHDNTGIVNMLIAQKANVNAVAQCPFGTTPLNLAAQCNKPIAAPVIQALIAAGAVVNVSHEFGHLPLYDAVTANAYHAIPVLIENGATLDNSILDRAKWPNTHLHTRKLLVTTVCPR